MTHPRPYQPLLLRTLHGLTGLFLLAAILTAFWTYDTYDGRWGGLSLPVYRAIEGVHGTFGLYTLLIFPVFVGYAFHRGDKRLIQPDSLAKLGQVGKPIWWYTLHRVTNTFALLALTFALFSGKMMDETWLPKGELNHAWYYAHLISWVIMVMAIALHLLLNAKVGGLSLLLSMLNRRFHPTDSPRLWATHISTHLSSYLYKDRLSFWSVIGKWRYFWQNRFQSRPILVILEVAIFVSLAIAWIISTIKQLP